VRNRWVTTKKAKEILEKLGPWLDKRPPLRKFTDRLDATVGTVWPLACIAGLYVNLDGALTPLRSALPAAKFHLSAMETAATEPELFSHLELLNLNKVRTILAAINDLELELIHAPAAFSRAADKRPRGRPKRSDWFIGFVRDLAEVAEEIGIPVTTGGNPAAAERQTAFTTLVYEVERVLPKEVRSVSLTACEQRVGRAIRDSAKWLGEPIARTRIPRKRRSRLRDK
jgi:hypothetical protein